MSTLERSGSCASEGMSALHPSIHLWTRVRSKSGITAGLWERPSRGRGRYSYPGILIPMGRNRATDDDRRRAAQLADFLVRKKKEAKLSVQDLSTNSNVRYETIRALLAGKSVGPSFFLVADLAAALDVKLDEIAKEAR